MKKKAVILVAEKDEEYFSLVQKSLSAKTPQYEIIRFCDGQTLLETLTKLKKKDTVLSCGYFLFLSMQIPQIDGLEILRVLKSDPELKKIPVMILIPSLEEQPVEQCYRSGCGLCLQKPEVFDRFAEMIQRIVDFLSVIEMPELAVLNGN